MIEMPAIKTQDDLFLFLMHTIHEKYQDSAILKGGMVLRLLGSQRETLDLDYVFVPFCSKKEILSSIKELFKSIKDLTSTISMNSKAIRINIEHKDLRAQVEINVSEKVKSTAISTAGLKEAHNSTAPRVIKIMSLDVALAHKMAAWNERRLLRDIYDIYYFLEVQNTLPDLDILKLRLDDINSRLPKIKKFKSMSLEDFYKSLKSFVDQLTQNDFDKELEGIVEADHLLGLGLRVKDSVNRFLVKITSI